MDFVVAWVIVFYKCMLFALFIQYLIDEKEDTLEVLNNPDSNKQSHLNLSVNSTTIAHGKISLKVECNEIQSMERNKTKHTETEVDTSPIKSLN